LGGGAGVLGAGSIDYERDVDRGVHSINRTARIAPMTSTAAAGFPSLAMLLLPNDGRRVH